MEPALKAVENITGDDDTAAHVQTIRRALEAEVARIKDHLSRWIEEHHSQSGVVNMALLELAIERLAASHGEHTFEALEGAYKKVMRTTLQ
jgi:hypothetical protein